MKRLKHYILTAGIGCVLFLSGCGSSEPVEVIDLNKVLDVVVDSMKQTSDKQAGGGVAGDKQDVASSAETAETAEPAETPKVSDAEKAKKMAEFLALCTENMNKAKLISKPIGLGLLKDGTIEGFVDPNKNSKKDSGEKQIFTVEIDAERNRLIATDTQNGYRRDNVLGGMATGLLAGALIGSMLSRQRGAGVSSSRYSNMKMNDKNYHSKARSSARAKSGSGSFSKGK
ncbi:MAG: hypothetical protein GY862_15000 [Gammaproteobacteria bacterium]|nr:hypothetical protein [Gammaproteobacteria bacterium]